jgi:hypothetical protein
MFQGEFTKLTNSLAPELLKTYVFLWDHGPKKPAPPARPVAPKGKEGDPEYDLLLIEYRQYLEDYDLELRRHKAAKAEFKEWQDKQGGALELMMFSCDANDALIRDPDRYTISSSTRGYEKAENHGLKPGHKPGRGHAENIQRMQDGEAELALAKRADPVFGSQELSQ